MFSTSDGTPSFDKKEHNVVEATDFLSREMMKLSVLDRTTIQEEVHGVKCMAVMESPELIELSLQEFQKELDRLPSSKKATYERILVHVTAARRAKELQRYLNNNNNSNYMFPTSSTSLFGHAHTTKPCTSQVEKKHYAIDDIDFRLRFLRTEFFNAKNAALRFANYLNFVHKFWGFEVVSERLIGMDDFSHEELRYLKRGPYQILPFRDRSGRRVLTLLSDSGVSQHRVSSTIRGKVAFYMADAITRDSVESQQRGIVVVADQKGTTYHLDVDVEGFDVFSALHKSAPSRIVARHFFLPNTLISWAAHKVVHTIARNLKAARYVLHVGCQDVEMRYILKGYGIPMEYFPVTETGTIKLKNLHHWIKNRILLEGNFEGKVLLVECPCLHDVVFRQGQSYFGNPGNSVFREAIIREVNRKVRMGRHGKDESNSDSNPNHSEMGPFFVQLKDQIHAKNGRFLKWDYKLKLWVQIIKEEELKRKVAVCLYNFERKNNSAITMARRDLLQEPPSTTSDPSATSNAIEGDQAFAFINGENRVESTCSISGKRLSSHDLLGGQRKRP